MVSPEQVIALEWAMALLACVFVGLRMGVRITQRQKNLLWSELWLLMGLVWLLALVVCDTLTYELDGMSEFVDVHPDLSKIRFASNYFFDAGLYFPKFSMLAIYCHLLPQQDSLQRWAYLFTVVVTIGSFITTLAADTFWCGPDVSVNWTTGPDSCSAYSSRVLMRLNWSLCFTTEVLLFLLPFPLLKGLGSTRRQEAVSLVALFALGLVTMAVSAGRFAGMMNLGNDISVYVWATTEFSVSQIIVASMALRPLVRKLWRSVSSSRNGGGGTADAQRESRRISTARAYNARTAVLIKEPLSPAPDAWSPKGGGDGDRFELGPYDDAGEHHAAYAKAMRDSVASSSQFAASDDGKLTRPREARSSRQTVSWAGDGSV